MNRKIQRYKTLAHRSFCLHLFLYYILGEIIDWLGQDLWVLSRYGQCVNQDPLI